MVAEWLDSGGSSVRGSTHKLYQAYLLSPAAIALAAVDESMLTGEARLVPVGEGATVTGGTLAYEAPLTLRATSTGSASTLAGIGRWVVVVVPGLGSGWEVEVPVELQTSSSSRLLALLSPCLPARHLRPLGAGWWRTPSRARRLCSAWRMWWRESSAMA